MTVFIGYDAQESRIAVFELAHVVNQHQGVLKDDPAATTPPRPIEPLWPGDDRFNLRSVTDASGAVVAGVVVSAIKGRRRTIEVKSEAPMVNRADASRAQLRSQ
ncbi:MAG TPA: hypothetical protein VGL72_05520 [Bryobacteraceae bacterium]